MILLLWQKIRYISVGESDEVQLFYYFVKSESNAQVDPLILWMTGGPGCSSLTALAFEFGPLHFEKVDNTSSLPRLILNPNSWTQMASFIFLDTPVGTGFSYTNNPDARKSDTMLACNEAHEFFRKFLFDHPEFISNPVYVGGDSFSGLIVPIVAELIAEGIEKGIEPPIDLKGYILGNPVTIPTDNDYEVPYAHGVGLISNELYEVCTHLNCEGNYQDIDPRNVPCLDDMNTFNQASNDFYLLSNLEHGNFLEPLCTFYAPKPRNLISDGSLDEKFLELKRRQRFLASMCRSDGYKLAYSWTNNDIVREVLQVPKGSVGNWQRCNYFGVSLTTTVRDCVPYHANLSRKGYRSLIYSGDHDLIVPHIATQAWIKSLNYSIVDDWRQWLVEGQVAGYTRTYANRMTFATVKGGGHTAPEYRPTECKAMVKRWLSHDPL
ncbi:OLC1v1016886C1 [Oldenlandia corymbosa var. corymbosa]|uniref:OLC1v1016886C1 n=1 Tax=Oldenlandia corymbosa var. corymbosa TaxID=529605 RepID=A0AAV1E857_OLDCO|nr:OLC1v1016886C1 [Oldenlandia corymbosa var. corymbosa]